jgi:hypothetical protein
MNYRHAYHAGNFAEVVKHATLARVVAHLREKPAAFRILDTHAGAGLTDLAAPEASRTGEWRDGIGRLRTASLDGRARALLAPYLDAVEACNPGGRLAAYPGSPVLARSWLRPHDRLVACELEPGAAAALARRMRGDARVKVMTIDGWTALTAYLPPKETPRRRPGRPAVRTARRVRPAGRGPCRRPPQMGHRHLSRLVPGQGPARVRCLLPQARPRRHRENPACRTDDRIRPDRDAPRREWAHRDQSALDPRGGLGGAASGACRGARPRPRGDVPARLADHRKLTPWPARPFPVRRHSFTPYCGWL